LHFWTVNALTKFVGQLLVVHLKLLLFLFKVEQEDVNQEDLCDAMEDDEIKIKESMEAMKSLFVRFLELHTVVQVINSSFSIIYNTCM